ncbi:MAG TPA: hypothetical protein HA236_05410 [Candidatus Nitrosotenuis sp.]|jgi:hypothetical protein|nr:hypothetical protein [Candidatus Nitrosotenuis sp.]
MPLDVIEEKNLNDAIKYALDYPSMVLTHAKSSSPSGSLIDVAYGLYIGYISGVFFDGFLQRNKRFLNDGEVSHYNQIINEQSQTIKMTIKASLHL